MSVWDEIGVASGEFVKFDRIGDTVSGKVVGLGVKVWDDGSKSPQLEIVTDEGESKTLTAGQVRLKLALAEQRPEIGDHIRVALSDIEKRSGGKTLKHFDVKVTRASGGTSGVSTDAPF